jgi:hypothetical protein
MRYQVKAGSVTALAIAAAALAFLPFGSSARATYVAAIFSEDTIVIGADSLITSADESPISDSFCKVVVLDNKTGFVGLGAAIYPLSTGEVVRTLDLVRTSAAPTIPESVRKFAEGLVAKLNSPPPGREPLRFNPFLIGLFGGFGEHETPMIENVTILYDNMRDVFLYSPPQTHINAEKIVAFSYPEATREIVDSAEFKRIRENRVDPERLAKTIQFLIDAVIKRKVSVEVGGVPTVLIIEKGRRPRWYSKAKDCPNLE